MKRATSTGLPGHPSLVFAVIAVLLAVGCAYLMHGTHALFTQAGDYRMRWVEEHYVFRGQNPIDIFEQARADAGKGPQPSSGRDTHIAPDLGPTDGGYPPWAYFTGAVWTWTPSFTAGRILFGVLNLALFAGLLVWAFRLGEEDRKLGWFLAASLFAVNSFCTTFIVGQYGVIVLATLILAWHLDARGRWLTAGLCLAVAMTKVTLAGPFVLPFIVRGRWRMLFTAGAYLALASLVVWPFVHTNPLAMLQQMSASAEHYASNGYSLNNLIELTGLDAGVAAKLAALLAVGLTAALLFAYRDSGLLTCYAIAGVGTRAWCYHALYDNLILVFLLLALGLVAWRGSVLALLCFALVGATLWLPGRLIHEQVWCAIQWTGWIGGLSCLLALQPREPITQSRPVSGPGPDTGRRGAARADIAPAGERS